MILLFWIGFTALVGNVQSLEISAEYLKYVGRSKRSVDTDNRPSCEAGDAAGIRVETTSRLAALREEMRKNDIDAYIIPSEDAHYSEYPSQYDARRGYISGFSGSAGKAVVLQDKAALWTDGRYFLQADQQLDCHNWILMRSGETNVPSITEWLLDELDGATNRSVGVYPFVFSSSGWTSYSEEFDGSPVSLKKVTHELIDNIWTEGRPHRPNTPINTLDATKFAGRTWELKVTDVRHDMADKRVDALVVTKLDEIAWLFNLRANDIDYNPFFISYAIVEKNRTRLYLFDHLTKLQQNASAMDSQSTQTLQEHLNTKSDGGCMGRTGHCVEVLEYDPDVVVQAVRDLVKSDYSGKIWISPSCNYAIFSEIPKNKVHQANTPPALQKIRKNEKEREGMRESHIRDAVALISFLAKLEKEVKAGVRWTEVTAAQELKKFREAQMYNRGLSFASISGSGANGAIIHYQPTNATDTPITTSDMYLLDSGGQYLDGTTDVTRTFHFGTPTDYEKECYTRVLMGQIDLALAQWPHGLYGRELDAFARAPLWDVGLIYRHGTGHGIGAFLSVHEGPPRISSYHPLNPNDVPLDKHMFFSDEPGFYEDGKFGIRLENIVMVTEKDTKYKFGDAKFLGFEQITLVPYEPHLIDTGLLTDKHIAFLKQYNKDIMDKVGPKLQSNTEAYDWLKQRVDIVSTFTNSGTHCFSSVSLIAFVAGLLSLMYV
ncbi:hypothetical protein ScPMuIL_013442 [Solemya velum]